MTEPLSDEWIAELAAAARTATIDPEARLVVQQVVEEPNGEALTYAVRLADGAVTVVPGRAADADVTFTQDRETAIAIATGRLSAQAAFMAGRLRVGGDLHAALGRAPGVEALDAVFAPARSSTG